MFRLPWVVLLVILLASCLPARSAASDSTMDSTVIAEILSRARADTFALASLQELCTEVGPRLAGSEGMRRAHDWARRWLDAAGADTIWAEEVIVPRWERGRESAYMVEPYEMPLNMLGLGRSVGTGGRPLTAEVLAVSDWDELEARADEAAGRIVVFSPPWIGYGPNVQYRVHAANRAAAHGAVAALIRPAGFGQNTPRTGVTRYDPDMPNIPTASLTEEDAALLLRMDRAGLHPRVELTMDARNFEDGPCANVIGEIRGRDLPEEIVLIGAHLDAWDTGQGAHDDGAGCVIMLGAVKVLNDLKLHPRRTIRVVLFTSEEYGGQGGEAYAERHADAIERHVLALESDSGAFAPRGFSVRVAAEIEDETIAILNGLAGPLAPLGAASVFPGWAGVDIGPLIERGVLGVGHRVHGAEYFSYHHGASDVFEAVDPDDLAANVAAVAGFVYAIAEYAEFDGNRLVGPAGFSQADH